MGLGLGLMGVDWESRKEQRSVSRVPTSSTEKLLFLVMGAGVGLTIPEIVKVVFHFG